ncbi:murein biosynthesis integral membrane protein MurJ [Aestuariimicrobium ganziense]|uniref:murein biosynthesis integral membrane protein MurJ n=1 Tax=Aestuariimicrobium ganziense TaxID=2773677 RepID=UPI001942BE69|nr:murein biosynthesis integral membrane protein MurJ [Aestuariimicrobium ganziense]
MTSAAQTSAKPSAAASLGRNSALMAAGTLTSRVLGLVRAALLTAAVGATLGGDAFAIANTLPNYVYILLSAGVLNAVLIPQITKAMARDDGGQDFVDRLLTASLLLVFGVAIAATVAAPLLIRLTTDLPEYHHQLTVAFAFICLPQIAFYGLYAVLGQVLNARDQFAAFMWTPVLANLVQIAGLIGFLALWGPQGGGAVWSSSMVWMLGGTSTLGIVVQGLALVIPLYRGGFRWRPRFGFRGHGLGSASKILGWTFTALVLAQLGGLFLQWAMTVIRGQDESVASVAVQQYAFLLFMLPHSFVTTSILTALYPQMSRAFNARDLPEARRLLNRGMSLPAVAVIPMSLGLVALALPVVRVVFPGMVHDQQVDVAWVLAAMAIGTMAFGLTTLQQRYCFAREDGRTNLALQGLLTAVHMGFGLLAFVVPKHWAVVTIALGQTIANGIAAIVFVLVARRQLQGLNLATVWRLYVRLTLAAAFAGLVAHGVAWVIGRFSSGFVGALLELGVAGVLFVGIFLGASKLMRIVEVDEFLAPVLRRLRLVR